MCNIAISTCCQPVSQLASGSKAKQNACNIATLSANSQPISEADSQQASEPASRPGSQPASQRAIQAASQAKPRRADSQPANRKVLQKIHTFARCLQNMWKMDTHIGQMQQHTTNKNALARRLSAKLKPEQKSNQYPQQANLRWENKKEIMLFSFLAAHLQKDLRQHAQNPHSNLCSGHSKHLRKHVWNLLIVKVL